MAAPIIRGDDSPQLQRRSFQYDYRQGGTYTEEHRGSSIPKMITKWNGIIYTAQRGKMSFENGVASAEFEWSGFPGSSGGTSAKELTIDRWEIPEPKTEKPLIQSPKIYDSFYNLALLYTAGATDAMIGGIAAQFQKGINENIPPADMAVGATSVKGWFNDDNFLNWTGLDATSKGYIIRAYNRCLNGQTHYQAQTYAVRHTTNAPSYWSANISDVNVNRVYTTAQLLSELQDSSLWYFPIPGRLAYKINAAANAFFNGFPSSVQSRTGYRFGWLKSPFGESSVGRTRMEIQGGYVLDQWPLDTYPAAT